MTVFGPLLDDADLRAALLQASGKARRMQLVNAIRADTVELLQPLAARVPVVPDRIASIYVAQGKARPAWDLNNNEQAVEFTLAAGDHATPSEKRLLGRLRACVAASEAGDVPPIADERLGAADREQKRTAGKAGKLTDSQKKRIVAKYQERVRNGQKYGAIKALAAEFKVSDKTISNTLETLRK